MNFKRIEIIFFIAFIALDIFLIFSYIQQTTMVDSTTNITQGSDDSIIKSIRNDQITIGSIGDDRKEGYYFASPSNNNLKEDAENLRYQEWDYENNKLTGEFPTVIRIKDMNNPQKTLDAVVKNTDQIVHGKQYRYSKGLSNKNMITYTQVVEGVPVYAPEGQLRFTVKNGYVTGYTQRYLEKPDLLREKRQTISGKKALIWLYQYNKLPANSEIKDATLAYTKLLNVNDNTIYIPTWNFTIQSKNSGSEQVRRINAFTGAIMDE